MAALLMKAFLLVYRQWEVTYSKNIVHYIPHQVSLVLSFSLLSSCNFLSIIDILTELQNCLLKRWTQSLQTTSLFSQNSGTSSLPQSMHVFVLSFSLIPVSNLLLLKLSCYYNFLCPFLFQTHTFIHYRKCPKMNQTILEKEIPHF